MSGDAIFFLFLEGFGVLNTAFCCWGQVQERGQALLEARRSCGNDWHYSGNQKIELQKPEVTSSYRNRGLKLNLCISIHLRVSKLGYVTHSFRFDLIARRCSPMPKCCPKAPVSFTCRDGPLWEKLMCLDESRRV